MLLALLDESCRFFLKVGLALVVFCLSIIIIIN